MCVSRSSGWWLGPVDLRSWFWTTQDSKRKIMQVSPVVSFSSVLTCFFLIMFLLMKLCNKVFVLQNAFSGYFSKVHKESQCHAVSAFGSGWVRVSTKRFDSLHTQFIGHTHIMETLIHSFHIQQWFCPEACCCPGPQPQLRTHHHQSCQQPTGGQRYDFCSDWD